jgi:hypothetical protein
MTVDPAAFYQAVIGAGATLSGFCGIFLAFRIQREASYYRQPVLSFDRETGKDFKDVFLDLTKFSAPLFLLLLATICSVIFGIILPLFALVGSSWALSNFRFIAAGQVAALILLGSYFLGELIHYEVLGKCTIQQMCDWGKEWAVVIIGLVGSLLGAALTYCLLR